MPRHLYLSALALGLSACGLVGASPAEQAVPRGYVTVTGSPECLAAAALDAQGNPMPITAPQFTEGVGTMTIGPVEQRDLASVVDHIRSGNCVTSTRIDNR